VRSIIGAVSAPDAVATPRPATIWTDPRPAARVLRVLLIAAAGVGLLAGIAITAAHLRTDPLADVRAYYDAGARLNAGQPLYPTGADTNTAGFYRYPPLLAIVFRPLALLPYEVVALLWGAAMVVAFALTVRRIGIRENTLIAMGILALPIGWSLAIGQAQVLVTLLMTLGNPVMIALAANLKLFPALLGLWWLGRRDLRNVALLAGWGLGLLGLQFILEPQATIDFFRVTTLEQVGEVNNLSPYALSPLLWLVLVAVGALVTLRLARTRWGWAAAVALSVLATPRLLSYMLMSLLAGLRSPDPPRTIGE
jgi:hypothetical protein